MFMKKGLWFLLISILLMIIYFLLVQIDSNRKNELDFEDNQEAVADSLIKLNSLIRRLNNQGYVFNPPVPPSLSFLEMSLF